MSRIKRTVVGGVLAPTVVHSKNSDLASGSRPAGTLTADEMLARMGDDPQTLILAIQLLERWRFQRLERAKRLRRSKRRAA